MKNVYFKTVLISALTGLWVACNAAPTDSNTRNSSVAPEDTSTHLIQWKWQSVEQGESVNTLQLMTKSEEIIPISKVDAVAVAALSGEAEIVGGVAVLGSAEAFPGLYATLKGNEGLLDCNSTTPFYLDQATGIQCTGEDGYGKKVQKQLESIPEAAVDVETDDEFGPCKKEELQKCLYYCLRSGSANTCYNDKESYGNCDEVKGSGLRFDRPQEACGGEAFETCKQGSTVAFCGFENWCALSDSDSTLKAESPDSNFDMCHRL